MIKRIKNEAKGSVYYGMHFYPGCAEYAEPNRDPYRVFLNDNTIRVMGPSFTGKPVFVHHVDEVEENLNKLRAEADGWVIESFYNQADGKHWVKFIVCSDKGEQAIKRGMKLSNCYLPKGFGPGGTWNGISYEREITGGEYEHLAIVPNPRYEESVIMTPEKFKEYNDEKLLELKKLANNKQGDSKMKFNWFKRQKVENSTDFDSMCVVLPKSGKEIEVAKLINQADEMEMKKDEPKVAGLSDTVEIEGEKVTVEELVKKYNSKKNKKNEDEDMDSEDPASMNDDDDMDECKMNEDEEDDEDEKKKMKMKDAKKNKDEDDDEDEEEKAEKANKKKNAKEKADRLRHANSNNSVPEVTVSLSEDKIARGKQLFGSSN